MLSESARMSSAAEARFRVQAPNSLPRAIKVIALDAAGEEVVRRLAAGDWKHATFLTAPSRDRAGAAGSSHDATQDVLSDVSGRTSTVADEVAAADLVVFVAGPGGHAQAVALIGEACSRRRVTTTGLVVRASSASEQDMAQTLAQLRPWSLMLVIASSDDYIDDMMTALRAS
jgi:hypothetical protein